MDHLGFAKDVLRSTGHAGYDPTDPTETGAILGASLVMALDELTNVLSSIDEQLTETNRWLQSFYADGIEVR